MNEDYQKFFELREKYPKLNDLIAELLATFFKNSESFPSKFYIFGTYDQSDVALILSNFVSSTNICTNPISIRKCICTFIAIY